ncbi:hypothetical protein BX070DRAFT_240584 [Coemansia spiralis]|nr:hypothetical protein BX070DRAFT_240584 [Coemansia spiralis]
MLPRASSRVRINIPTVNVSEAWTPTPLRKQHLGLRLVRLYIPLQPQHEYEHVDFHQLTDLIIVPGHGIYTSEGPPLNESSWQLLKMQQGEVGAFMAHIGKGVEMVKEHDSALLIFSGGKTRLRAGSYSEAQGYWAAADRMGWLTKDVYRRVFTEEYARDSYENVLFSVARFREITGRYPDRITVVGFDFKRERFLDLHRKALRYPKIRFNYIGINPPGDSSELLKNERENAYNLFAKDLYGCTERLAEKRRERNPFLTVHGYAGSCPEIAPFFSYCPDNPVAVYDGPLPWLS